MFTFQTYSDQHLQKAARPLTSENCFFQTYKVIIYNGFGQKELTSFEQIKKVMHSDNAGIKLIDRLSGNQLNNISISIFPHEKNSANRKYQASHVTRPIDNIRELNFNFQTISQYIVFDNLAPLQMEIKFGSFIPGRKNAIHNGNFIDNIIIQRDYDCEGIPFGLGNGADHLTVLAKVSDKYFSIPTPEGMFTSLPPDVIKSIYNELSNLSLPNHNGITTLIMPLDITPNILHDYLFVAVNNKYSAQGVPLSGYNDDYNVYLVPAKDIMNPIYDKTTPIIGRRISSLIQGTVERNSYENLILGSAVIDTGAPSGFPHLVPQYRLLSLEFKDPTLIDNLSGNVPHKFELRQNYPNPFNNSTTIEFSLPRQSQVSIMVYDALGQEVANLANDVHLAGKHYVRFDASELPSGAYAYVLRAGDLQETKKMIIVK